MRSEYNIIWEQTHPIDWLRVEYSIRRSRNPQYSLRAFAKYLRVSSGPLSEILAKKRNLTPKLGKKISERLGYGEEEQKKFLELINKVRKKSKQAPEETDAPLEYRLIEADQFSVISDWYHYGLLSLMETKDFKSNEKWMASRLNISVLEVRSALERLERMGLIQLIKGHWIGTGQWTSPQDFHSLAGRKFHRQGLEQAMHSLENTPMELRDITSMTMAISPAKIPLAKKMITNFRRQVAKVLEEGERKEVYKLNVQLIPVSFPMEDK